MSKSSVWHQPTIVYVAHAVDDSVLYVGITNDIKRRLKEHRASSSWWGLHDKIKTTTYPSRTEAKTVESDLIARLSPSHNVAETDRHAEAVRASWGKRKHRLTEKHSEPRFIASPTVTVNLLSDDEVDHIDDLIARLIMVRDLRRPQQWPRYRQMVAETLLELALSHTEQLIRNYGYSDDSVGAAA